VLRFLHSLKVVIARVNVSIQGRALVRDYMGWTSRMFEEVVAGWWKLRMLSSNVIQIVVVGPVVSIVFFNG